MELTDFQPVQRVDLCGLHCPHLLIAVIACLDRLLAGQILELIADDLSAPSNVSAWCRQSGQELLALYLDNGRFLFHIRRRDALA